MRVEEEVTFKLARGLRVLWKLFMLLGDYVCWFFMILNRQIYTVNEHKPRTDFNHKVVLIGDGLAMGFGGFGQIGYPSGCCRALTILYKRVASIRTNWCFIDRGVLRSTSAQWLPDGKLWKWVFGHKTCEDVDVVVVMVGLADVLNGLADDHIPLLDKASRRPKEFEIITNIRKIGKAIKAQGMRLCLCEIPMLVPEGHPRTRLIKAINEQIIFVAKELTGQHQVPVVRASAPRLAKAECRSTDGLHFNNRGYKLLGEMMLEELRGPLTQIEWACFKEYITGRKEPPVRRNLGRGLLRRRHDDEGPPGDVSIAEGAVQTMGDAEVKEEEEVTIDQETKKTQ